MSKKYEKRIERLKKDKNEEERHGHGSNRKAKRTLKSEKDAQKEFKRKLDKGKKIW